MKTTRYPVDLRSTYDALLALFEAAERGDVEQGGRYDRRGAAINVWSHPWTTDATRHDSETIGTFSVRWADDNCLYQIACDAGFDLADLLHALAVLEETALGSRQHGVKRFERAKRCTGRPQRRLRTPGTGKGGQRHPRPGARACARDRRAPER